METGILGLRIKSGSFSRYHTVLSFIHRLIFRARLFFCIALARIEVGMEFHVVVQRVIPSC